MKKAKLILSGIVIATLLVACGSDSNSTDTSTPPNNEVEAPTPAQKTDQPTDDSQTEQNAQADENPAYPDYIETFHQSYLGCVSTNNLDIQVGDISTETKEGLTYYKFPIGKDISATMTSSIEIVEAQDYYSYELIFGDGTENTEKKELITVAIASSEGIPLKDAEKSVKKIVNSYDGHSASDVVKLKNFRYRMDPPMSYALSDGGSLHIGFINQPDFDESKYPALDPQGMNAAMNEGEIGKISGKVKEDAIIDGTGNLEIRNKDGKFWIYYNPDNYGGDFKIGKKYTFFGTVVKSRQGYDGVLRADYCK